MQVPIRQIESLYQVCKWKEIELFVVEVITASIFDCPIALVHRLATFEPDPTRKQNRHHAPAITPRDYSAHQAF